MPINSLTYTLAVGDRVEVHKSGEVGYVHKLSATEAVVRVHGTYRKMHPRQLTRLPTEAEMTADKNQFNRASGVPLTPDLE